MRSTPRLAAPITFTVAYAPSTTNSRKSRAITVITASTTLLLRTVAAAAASLFNGKRNGQVRSSRRTPNLPVGDYP
ncbi:hypothetical protein [Streptomyces olivochromogenes]|uniref:hypothetical protein n=1 Tax=Streptomyces olivochromogenes TaxID=1963 RepID=UPI003CC5EE7E